MDGVLLRVFDTTGFPARWHCGNWSSFLGWLHIVSDAAIFGAYLAIPIALGFFIRERRDLPKPFPVIFWLFGAFIVACGLSHLIEAVIFWKPVYRLAGVVKAGTAAVSWTTLAFLVPAVPKALALKSPEHLERQVIEATAQLRRERDAAAHLAGIVESSQDAIFSQDLEGQVQSWNPAAMRIFGHSAQEITGHSADILVPPERQEELAATLMRAREGHVIDQLETERVRKDGSRFAASITISPFFDQQGQLTGLSMIVRDISSRRKAEALFRAAVDASPSGMIAVDHAGRIVLINTEAERLFGYAQAELLGEPVERLVPQPKPSERAQPLLDYSMPPGAGSMGRRREVLAIRKNGTTFPVEVGLNPIEVDGDSLILSAIVDRTEVKQEKEALEAKKTELERSNEELEQFAYVASHDLQEPLRMVVNFMDLLKRSYSGSLDETANQYVDFAVDGAHRMKQLVDALLIYSRVDGRGGKFERVNLQDTLDSVRKTLPLLVAESGARIVSDVLPVVWGDAGQLEQLFQNLLSNAIKFRGERPPEIVVRCRENATEWEVTVEDNGIGFEARHADRIFQMFQRLHERSLYAGSGIGLAISKRIVSRHGGRMWATAVEGIGATFHFTLPKRGALPSPVANDAQASQ